MDKFDGSVLKHEIDFLLLITLQEFDCLKIENDIIKMLKNGERFLW